MASAFRRRVLSCLKHYKCLVVVRLVLVGLLGIRSLIYMGAAFRFLWLLLLASPNICVRARAWVDAWWWTHPHHTRWCVGGVCLGCMMLAGTVWLNRWQLRSLDAMCSMARAS